MIISSGYRKFPRIDTDFIYGFTQIDLVVAGKDEGAKCFSPRRQCPHEKRRTPEPIGAVMIDENRLLRRTYPPSCNRIFRAEM